MTQYFRNVYIFLYIFISSSKHLSIFFTACRLSFFIQVFYKNIFALLSNTMSSLQLYRSMMRQAKHIHDYNFREYALRRVKAGFRQHSSATGCVRVCRLCGSSLCVCFGFCCVSFVPFAFVPSSLFLTLPSFLPYFLSLFFLSFFSSFAQRQHRPELQTALQFGQEQLQVMQRFAHMSQSYPSARSVMETAPFMG